MKNVIIFGFGDRGRKLVDECLAYGAGIIVTAIMDNHAAVQGYRGIPVVKPQRLPEYAYDEIWICTVYFKEVMGQLAGSHGVERGRMRYVEPVAPILESRLREKYRAQMECPEPAPGELGEVLSWLKGNPLRMYCYPFFDEYLYREAPVRFDGEKGLYYGIYEGKKMYLARRFDTEQKAGEYFNSITMEQDARSPHCYWNDARLCHASGIGVDVGAAEGIFALKMVGQAEHIYLVEADGQWVEALRHTFAPWHDRVTIVPKYIGNEDSGGCARLDTLLQGKGIGFMKIDIEGMELDALKGAEKLLSGSDARLAVCVYHYEAENGLVGSWLEQRGYRTGNSRGLVACQGEWELESNETGFRKALLFAGRGA